MDACTEYTASIMVMAVDHREQQIIILSMVMRSGDDQIEASATLI